MISVYDIGNENFRQNGDVILKPTEGKMRVIAGGDYSLTMTHPVDAEGKWKHIAPGAILKIPIPEERIENAFAGYAQDIYKTTAEAQLRESPQGESVISYSEWTPQTAYEVGDKVSIALRGKNYKCVYWDGSSPMSILPPYACDWWTEIPRRTSGAPILATLPTGTELYFIEDVDATWIKLSTYYGLEGYVLKSQVTFDRHVDPSEVQPRIIDDQLFRMEQPTVDTKNRTVTVTAKHVSYDLAGNLVQKVSLSQAAPAMAIGKMVEGLMIPYRGTIATNLTAEDNGTYTGEIKGKNGIFALLDPDKGIVSTFGAEYRRDNWDIFIMTKTETDRGFRIRYRKNMLGVNWNRDSSKIVNRIVPVAKNEKGEELYLPEKWVDSPDIADYPVIKMEMLQVSGQVGKDKGLGDDSKWTEADLLDEMRTKAAERFTVDHADETEETVTIDFEQLGSTEEYAALKGLEKVLLYDKVEAENKEIGLTRKLYVTELEFDFVKEKVTALKLTNAVQYKKGTVTGFSVQNKSIGSDKLADDVTSGIISQVREIIPEYAAPYEQTLHVNTKDQDGYVLKGQGQAGKVWKTDVNGNPAWREATPVVTDPAVDTTKADNDISEVHYLGMGNATDKNGRRVGFMQTIAEPDGDVGWLSDVRTYDGNGDVLALNRFGYMLARNGGVTYIVDAPDRLRQAISAGDASGPSSATDGHVAVFDGATGKLLKDSGKALPAVVDNLTSTSTADALSANQGKTLQDNKLDKVSRAYVGNVADSRGQNYYFKLATLTITRGYIDRTVIFEVSRREYGYQRLGIKFNSTSSTDPGLNSFITDGRDNFWIKKASAGVWEIYGQYVYYGDCRVHRVYGDHVNDGINITIDCTNTGSTEPTGATRVVFGWNANHATVAETLQNSVTSLTALHNEVEVGIASADQISITPTNASNFSSYGNSWYCKKGNRVTLHLGLQSISGQNKLICTLPTGYRPPTYVIGIGTGGTSYTGIAIVTVNANGEVYVTSYDQYCCCTLEFTISA